MPDSGEPIGDRSLIGEIDRIIAMDERPVLRNLLITQCYHDLSSGLAEVLGAENANWCTYATWASKTAGQFIRREEVPGALHHLVLDDDEVFEQRLARRCAAFPDGEPDAGRRGLGDIFDRVTMAVSVQITLGNLEVFSELGPVFARFIDAFRAPAERTEATLQEQLDHLRDGPSSRDGQSVLQQAVRLFFEAMLEQDEKLKAQKMLHANGLTGLHEQIRLNPYIEGSLIAPVEEVVDESIGDLSRLLPGRRLEAMAERFLHRLAEPIEEGLEKAWIEAATLALMTLKLPPPDGTLRLGRSLSAAEGHHLYPRPLHTIDDLGLALALETFSALEDDPHAEEQDDPGAEHHAAPPPDQGRDDDEEEAECGAEDWSRLGERMHYIFPLFRSRQRLGYMLEQPFTGSQHRAILDDRVPEGDEAKGL